MEPLVIMAQPGGGTLKPASTIVSGGMKPPMDGISSGKLAHGRGARELNGPTGKVHEVRDAERRALYSGPNHDQSPRIVGFRRETY